MNRTELQIMEKLLETQKLINDAIIAKDGEEGFLLNMQARVQDNLRRVFHYIEYRA